MMEMENDRLWQFSEEYRIRLVFLFEVLIVS